MPVMIFKTIEEIPEELRDKAEKKELGEGKVEFHLDGTGLINKNKELLGDIKKYQTAADQLKQFAGLDPVKAKQALEEMTQLETKKKALDEQVKAAIATAQAEWAKEKAAIVGEKDSVLGQLDEFLMTTPLKDAIKAAKGEEALLLPTMVKHVKIFVENGKRIPKIIDPLTQQPRISAKTSEPFKPEELVEEFKAHKIFGKAFEGTAAAGSGATGAVAAGGDGVIHLKPEQAKDVATYREAVKKAGSVDKVVIDR